MPKAYLSVPKCSRGEFWNFKIEARTMLNIRQVLKIVTGLVGLVDGALMESVPISLHDQLFDVLYPPLFFVCELCANTI